MKVLDYSVLTIFVIALVVIFFFWGCHLDPIVTAIAGVVAIASGIVTFIQYKKLKDLQDDASRA